MRFDGCQKSDAIAASVGAGVCPTQLFAGGVSRLEVITIAIMRSVNGFGFTYAALGEAFGFLDRRWRWGGGVAGLAFGARSGALALDQKGSGQVLVQLLATDVADLE